MQSAKPSKKQINQKLAKIKSKKLLLNIDIKTNLANYSKAVLGDKTNFHPRNQHRKRYDFDSLILTTPTLANFVKLNAYSDNTIDFADPNAVIALNKALLAHHYHVSDWDIPAQYLCPAIPGRADYIHYLADLLNSDIQTKSATNKTKKIRILDIGVGANMVYPLIANHEYGWQCVGSDIDETALNNANTILQSNDDLKDSIELRLQTNATHYFEGIINSGDTFDLTLCNPPFHASIDEAEAGNKRKLNGLAKSKDNLYRNNTERSLPVSLQANNFGGNSLELVCNGGEQAFICGMISESQLFASQVTWFSSLVSKESSLPAIYSRLAEVGVTTFKTINMAQGQKKSRFIAWSFKSK